MNHKTMRPESKQGDDKMSNSIYYNEAEFTLNSNTLHKEIIHSKNKTNNSKNLEQLSFDNFKIISPQKTFYLEHNEESSDLDMSGSNNHKNLIIIDNPSGELQFSELKNNSLGLSFNKDLMENKTYKKNFSSEKTIEFLMSNLSSHGNSTRKDPKNNKETNSFCEQNYLKNNSMETINETLFHNNDINVINIENENNKNVSLNNNNNELNNIGNRKYYTDLQQTGHYANSSFILNKSNSHNDMKNRHLMINTKCNDYINTKKLNSYTEIKNKIVSKEIEKKEKKLGYYANTKRQNNRFKETNSLTKILHTNINLQRSLICISNSDKIKLFSDYNFKRSNENDLGRISKIKKINSYKNNITRKQKYYDILRCDSRSSNIMPNTVSTKSSKEINFIEIEKVNSNKQVTRIENKQGKVKETIVVEGSDENEDENFNNDDKLVKSQSQSQSFKKKVNFERKNRVYDSLSEKEEILKSKSYNYFYIDANSSLRKTLESLNLFICLYSLAFLPIKLILVGNSPSNILTILLELVFDFLNFLDFLTSFFTAYYDFEENYITDLKRIVLNYTRTYMFFDLLSAIPLNSLFGFNQYLRINDSISKESLFYENRLNFYLKTDSLFINDLNSSEINYGLLLYSNYKKLDRLVILNRIFKVFKTINGNRILSEFKNYFMFEFFKNYTLQFKIIYFYFMFLILSHLLTCIYFFIGTTNYPSWITKANLHNSSFGHIYLTSLYFNHLTIFSVGYGDIISTNNSERIYNILLMIVGVMLYSFALTSISNIIKTNEEISKIFDNKKEYLDKISTKYSINKELYDKLNRHLIHEKKTDKMSKLDFLATLPISLRNEMVLCMNKELIENFNFFKKCYDNEFIIKVILTLKDSTSSKKDILIKQGDLVEEIIFVKNGSLILETLIEINEKPNEINSLKSKDTNKLDIFTPSNFKKIKIAQIQKYEHFGDSLLIDSLRSPFSLITNSKKADIFLMNKSDVIKLSEEFIYIFEKIYEKSSFNFMQMIEKIDHRKFENKNGCRDNFLQREENVNQAFNANLDLTDNTGELYMKDSSATYETDKEFFILCSDAKAEEDVVDNFSFETSKRKLLKEDPSLRLKSSNNKIHYTNEKDKKQFSLFRSNKNEAKTIKQKDYLEANEPKANNSNKILNLNQNFKINLQSKEAEEDNKKKLDEINYFYINKDPTKFTLYDVNNLVGKANVTQIDNSVKSPDIESINDEFNESGMNNINEIIINKIVPDNSVNNSNYFENKNNLINKNLKPKNTKFVKLDNGTSEEKVKLSIKEHEFSLNPQKKKIDLKPKEKEAKENKNASDKNDNLSNEDSGFSYDNSIKEPTYNNVASGNNCINYFDNKYMIIYNNYSDLNLDIDKSNNSIALNKLIRSLDVQNINNNSNNKYAKTNTNPNFYLIKNKNTESLSSSLKNRGNQPNKKGKQENLVHVCQKCNDVLKSRAFGLSKTFYDKYNVDNKIENVENLIIYASTDASENELTKKLKRNLSNFKFNFTENSDRNLIGVNKLKKTKTRNVSEDKIDKILTKRNTSNLINLRAKKTNNSLNLLNKEPGSPIANSFQRRLSTNFKNNQPIEFLKKLVSKTVTEDKINKIPELKKISGKEANNGTKSSSHIKKNFQRKLEKNYTSNTDNLSEDEFDFQFNLHEKIKKIESEKIGVENKESIYPYKNFFKSGFSGFKNNISSHNSQKLSGFNNRPIYDGELNRVNSRRIPFKNQSNIYLLSKGIKNKSLEKESDLHGKLDKIFKLLKTKIN